MLTICLVLFSYLLGSIPTAFLAGKMIKGLDLRQYGSGTVSGTGVYNHVARWAVVPVRLFDVAKAAVPTWLGLRFRLGLPAAVSAGLAAAVGHNWPLYLGFRGGRGISTFMGTLLVVFPWGFPWLLAALAIGRLLGATAVLALFGIALLPLLTWATGQPSAVTGACLAMLVLTVLKRLEGNRAPLPEGPAERQRVCLNRLLLDRDTRSRDAWMLRRPPG